MKDLDLNLIYLKIILKKSMHIAILNIHVFFVGNNFHYNHA